MKIPLRIAYNQWRVWQPDTVRGHGAVCCFNEHFISKAFSEVLIPIDDNLVCKRELAWRHYVRRRDNDPSYGTAIQKFKGESLGETWRKWSKWS